MSRKKIPKEYKPNGEKFIVKVMKPAFNENEPGYFVIDEKQKHSTRQLLSRDTFNLLEPDRKGYFEAVFDHEQQIWVIGKKVAEQTW